MLSSINVVFNEFFKMIQSLSSIPIMGWLIRSLALYQAVFENDWPDNYAIKDGDTFDFIVVGSGSAGSIVAARLSELPNFNVVLIEAGGNPPVTSVVPGLFPLLPKTEFDWNYRATFDDGVGIAHQDGILPYTRGKVLGGCSSINYLIYTRGVPQDYEDWNKIAHGWDWNSVLYYFKKLEGMTDRLLFEYPKNARLHSSEGPVKVSRPVTFASTAKIDKIRLDSYEEMGIKKVLEANGPETFGATRPHLIIDGGRRFSTAEAYLKPARHRPNLKVAKYVTATRILFNPRTLKAHGVEIATTDKKILQVYAKKEVILSAGVINSPKILLQSGIGPADELSKLGINVLLNLPVGKNFHDHQLFQMVVEGKKGLSTAAENVLVASRLDTVPIPLQSGLFRLNGTLNYPSRLQPQLQFFSTYIGAGASVVLFVGCKTITNYDNSYCASLAEANIFSEVDVIVLALLHPLSRGQVSLSSKNPFDDPVIHLGYFRNEYDLLVAAEGLKYMSGLVNTNYYRKVGGSVARLKIRGCESYKWGTDEYWRCYAKNAVASLQHGVGTCSMGYDGVVDERLRVHKVKGLRVVDGSVIPKIPSGNINVPIMMIGEKAADMIKCEYGDLKSCRF